jgi:hypothetical protein
MQLVPLQHGVPVERLARWYKAGRDMGGAAPAVRPPRGSEPPKAKARSVKSSEE